jgi:methylphosphotriester-DNA--protein-cysteine methyltransferase
MISPSCDIREFIEAVKDKEYFEVISLADKEALKAWRRSYRTGKRATDESASCKRYEGLLKEIARHIRSSVAPDWKSVAELGDLRHLREAYLAKENGH